MASSTIINDDFEIITNELRREFRTGRTLPVSYRKEQLGQLYRFLDDNQNLIIETLKKDLRKPWFETVIVEVDFVLNEIRSTLANIDQYCQKKCVAKSFTTLFDDTFVHHEPYGLVLIVGAWNYPVQIILAPLVGAIAAGNVAIIKPSELAPESAHLISKLLPRYLDRRCYRVVTGDAEKSKRLLEYKFDYIFFTGSGSIGRVVHQAAARHLTPTTLELGGKSPIYLHDSLPPSAMKIACRRMIWGKMMNAGQTCIAPDYVLCSQKVRHQLEQHLINVIEEFFGHDPQKTDDFGRIVNQRHFDRLINLLNTSSGKIFYGGKIDANDRYISPTIIFDVSPDDPIMKEEIFGPIFPFITVRTVDEAIQFINKRPKPLAIYLFAEDKVVTDRFIQETSSGALCVNDVVLHVSLDTLPFGGVGESGMGAYHGHYSFNTFSHQKAVLVRGYNGLLEIIGSRRYPPYSHTKLARLLRLLKKRQLPFDDIPYRLILTAIISFIFGLLVAYTLIESLSSSSSSCHHA
ncbi:aldehyde dehydrogenase 3, member A2 [Dermatophagoides farinae]|uniref:Aldehyde dehydrogenase n=2 Tax=Dermatophagoides farinae TaxID=6954 RepID=A0A922L067_DERFA|nr:aldehyde dehydrogenase 3, member A2 [Dermatophagoides farinae]